MSFSARTRPTASMRTATRKLLPELAISSSATCIRSSSDELRMHVALEEIANSGSSFLVAVRIDAVGRVRALNDIPVPRRYADLFTEIPEHRFRFDTSSSEIRARGRAVGNS